MKQSILLIILKDLQENPIKDSVISDDQIVAIKTFAPIGVDYVMFATDTVVKNLFVSHKNLWRWEQSLQLE